MLLRDFLRKINLLVILRKANVIKKNIAKNVFVYYNFNISSGSVWISVLLHKNGVVFLFPRSACLKYLYRISQKAFGGKTVNI